MKRFFLQSFSKISLIVVCAILFCTVSVYAFSENLRLQYLMSFVSDYSFTISLSTDGTTYNNIYDNSGNTTIASNNFTINPQINDEITITSIYSNLSQIVYIKITNFTENTTIQMAVSSLKIYGTSASVSGINPQTATFNTTSSAIQIDLGTGIEPTDPIVIGLTITETA